MHYISINHISSISSYEFFITLSIQFFNFPFYYSFYFWVASGIVPLIFFLFSLISTRSLWLISYSVVSSCPPSFSCLRVDEEFGVVDDWPMKVLKTGSCFLCSMISSPFSLRCDFISLFSSLLNMFPPSEEDSMDPPKLYSSTYYYGFELSIRSTITTYDFFLLRY